MPTEWWKYTAGSVSLGLCVMGGVLLFTIEPGTLSALGRLSSGVLAVLIMMVLASWFFHGCRVWLLSRTMGHDISLFEAIRISISVEFAVAATPGGAGGAVTRLGLFKSRGLPLYISTSILAVNIFMDALFFSLIALSSVTIVFTSSSWREILNIGGQIEPGRCAIAACGAFCLGPRLSAAKDRALKFAKMSWHTVRHIFRRHRVAVITDFMLAICQFTCRYMVLPVLVWVFAGYINPLPLITAQGLLFLVGLLLVLPGGGGGVEAIGAVILPAIVQKDLVGIVLILWRTFTYYFYLIVGGLIFAWTLTNIAENGNEKTDSEVVKGSGPWPGCNTVERPL